MPRRRDSVDELVRRERAVQVEKITAMQTLSAALAHEVRNPLNAAKLQLEVLQRRLARIDADGQLLAIAGRIDHELERLNVLLAEYLAYARPARLARQRHDLAAIARDVVELERELADERGAVLAFDARAPVYVMIDAAKINQVVTNLVRNAIEAVPAGGRVDVTVDDGDERARVRVADDGPGIPDGLRARIYEPFFSTKEDGTGMGMAIVKTLVELHGGTIALDATRDRGTAFTVTFPRA